jgi:hypothetical protein
VPHLPSCFHFPSHAVLHSALGEGLVRCHMLRQHPAVDERDADQLRRELEGILITAEECQVG